MPLFRCSMQAGALLIISMMMGTAMAATYECPGKYDKKIYTDKPCEDGHEIEIPPSNTYKPEEVPPRAAESEAEDADKSMSYKTFAISKPKKNEVIRVSQWKITVKFKISPELQKGDHIVLKLNGKKVKLKKSYIKVTRGPHKLSAAIWSSDGTLLKKAKSVKFHVRSVGDGGVNYFDKDKDGIDDNTGLLIPKGSTGVKPPRAPQAPQAPRAPGL